MSLVSKDILNGVLYVSLNGKWEPLSLSNYKKAWNQGFLYNLLDEMEEKGIPIPMVWNQWELQETYYEEEGDLVLEWTLVSISESEPKAGLTSTYGEPGLLPTQEQFDKAVKEREEQTLLAQAKAKLKETKAMEEANSLNALLASIKGGKVVEFNKDYLIIETEAGLLKVGAQMVYCSTDDYEGYDEARLHFSSHS